MLNVSFFLFYVQTEILFLKVYNNFGPLSKKLINWNIIITMYFLFGTTKNENKMKTENIYS